MRDMQLVLLAEGGRAFRPKPTTFLLFIDETGDESLNDPNFPIFGFGGVGVPASLYVSNIVRPWIWIKEDCFGGKSAAMHAADLRDPTQQQLSRLNEFFTRCAFCRLGCVISDKTVFDGTYDVYEVAAKAFYNRIRDVLRQTEFDEIYMIFEDSERGTPKTERCFSGTNIVKTRESGTTYTVPCEKFIMSKAEREPGLEVADCVAHTAGASVLSRLRGKRKKGKERRDFAAIFQSGHRLSSFLEITRIKEKP